MVPAMVRADVDNVARGLQVTGEEVAVHLGGLRVRVPEDLRELEEVGLGLEEEGGEGVPELVRAPFELGSGHDLVPCGVRELAVAVAKPVDEDRFASTRDATKGPEHRIPRRGEAIFIN